MGGPSGNGAGPQGAEGAGNARALSLATRLLHPRKTVSEPYGAVSPPIYQTATFDQVSAVECGPYDYTRSGNPTRTLLETQMADLEVGTLWAPYGFGWRFGGKLEPCLRPAQLMLEWRANVRITPAIWSVA